MKTNKIRVDFTRSFTAGPLIGLTHDDSISFVSRQSAAGWIKGIRRNSRLGKLEYRLTAARSFTLNA